MGFTALGTAAQGQALQVRLLHKHTSDTDVPWMPHAPLSTKGHDGFCPVKANGWGRGSWTSLWAVCNRGYLRSMAVVRWWGNSGQPHAHRNGLKHTHLVKINAFGRKPSSIGGG